MTQLGACKVGAAVDFAVDDDAAADAGAQCDGNRVFGALGAAREVFTQSRRVCVVFDEHLGVKALLHHLHNLPVVEEQVGGILDHARLGIDRTRNADADALDVVHGQLSLLDRLFGDLRHAVADLAFGTGHCGFAGCARNDFIFLVNNTRHNVGAAQVDT